MKLESVFAAFCTVRTALPCFTVAPFCYCNVVVLEDVFYCFLRLPPNPPALAGAFTFWFVLYTRIFQ